MSSLSDRSPPSEAYCRVCLKDRGLKLHVPLPSRLGMKERRGKLDKRTGRCTWICAVCLLRGKLTYLD